MKFFQFLILPFVLAALFSQSGATSVNIYENFLQCLSIRSSDYASITKVVYTPYNSSYSSVLDFSLRNLRFNTPDTPKPLIIVTPLNTSHIQATIYCSREYGLQIRTRSGGHDFEGISYVSEVPFLMLDLINLRSVEIDVENKVAWVQSAATLGELYYNIANRSGTLAFAAGICHTVGVGGYFSGGGYGLLFRKYGLAADNIIDAVFIDVNGRILDRKAMGEDLFWAIRGGGGGSFGIVLAWKLRLVSVPPTVTVFNVMRTLQQNATKLVHRWQEVAHNYPDGTFFVASLRRAQNGVVASFTLFYLGGVDELLPLMQERFPELGIVKEDCTETRWIDAILFFGGFPNQPLDLLLNRTIQTPLFPPAYKAKSDYVKEPIPESAIQELCSRLLDEDAINAVLAFFAYGGIMDRIPEDATPFPHRAGNLYKILYTAGWQQEDSQKAIRYISWMRRVYRYMGSFVSKSPREAYVNYRDLDLGTNNIYGSTSYAKASVWGHKYFKNNFNKLVQQKTMIDPKNFFRHEQSIPPLLS